MTAADQAVDDLDLHAPEFVRDPYAVYETLRRECPVAHGTRHGGYWLLSRYEDVRGAARDWRTYTSSVPGVTAIPTATRRTEPLLPLEIDPPRHSRYRALVNPVFAPARIEALRGRIESISDGLVVEALARLARGDTVDLVGAYCVPLSVLTLAEFTGLPRDDAPRWVEWQKRMFDVHDRGAGEAATREMNAYIAALVEQRVQHPAAASEGDFITSLLASEVDGHRLTPGEIRAFCQVQFGAGFETTADAMSVAIHYLATHPEIREQLVREPELLGARGSGGPAVEEFLRYATPIQVFGRNATHDLELHGQSIPKGDVVALSFASANHDPSVFDRPDECVLDRFRGPIDAKDIGRAAESAPRHLTFGAGVHLCLGAPVARLELGITLRQFSSAIQALEIAPEGVTWKARGDRRGLAALPVTLKAR